MRFVKGIYGQLFIFETKNTYMKLKVNSSVEVSSRFEILFRLHGDFTAAILQIIARLYLHIHIVINFETVLINAKQSFGYWLFFQ